MNLIPQAVRDGFARLLGPLAAWLIRMHVRPNVLTTVGTLVVVGSAMTFALGKARWAVSCCSSPACSTWWTDGWRARAG